MKTLLKTSSESIIRQFLADNPQLIYQEPQLNRAIDILCNGYRKHALMMTCGNGGSASDSSHIVGELVKSFRAARPLDDSLRQKLLEVDPENGAEMGKLLQKGLRALALSSESILLTAMGNDVGFSLCFAQQVCALGRPGDILIALSTSGKSANVVKALQVAKAMGLTTIGLTGQRPCPMQSLCDVLFQVPSEETYRIQEFHLAIYHVLCAVVENELFTLESAIL